MRLLLISAYLTASVFAEATVLGGKESKASKSTLPALGSEKMLNTGEGIPV